MAISIFVADEHPIVRDGLEGRLESESGFRIVGQAASCDEIVDAVARTQPDIALVDIELSNEDGVPMIPRLFEASPRTRIVIFSHHDEDERVLRAVRAGVQGYLLKDSPVEELVQALRAVHAGGTYLQPRITSKVVDYASRNRRTLSSRELEVLKIVARGRSNAEIAETLQVTERTIKSHVSSILQKLDARNRAHAAVIALERGLIPGP